MHLPGLECMLLMGLVRHLHLGNSEKDVQGLGGGSRTLLSKVEASGWQEEREGGWPQPSMRLRKAANGMHAQIGGGKQGRERDFTGA